VSNQSKSIFDATNAAVLRHPGRQFPGCLVQGDTLYSLLHSLKLVQLEAAGLSENTAAELSDVVEHLKELLQHYSQVLEAHHIELPFHRAPDK
jgi:hypothetical protein